MPYPLAHLWALLWLHPGRARGHAAREAFLQGRCVRSQVLRAALKSHMVALGAELGVSTPFSLPSLSAGCLSGLGLSQWDPKGWVLSYHDCPASSPLGMTPLAVP